MQVLILNGTPAKGYSEFRRKLFAYKVQLNTLHQVDQIDLHDKNLGYCQGCFNCWWKTPGECTIRDDIDAISSAVMNAERVIFASPLIHGFPSHLIKMLQDRLLPLLMPYIQLIGGECHHERRYNKYPTLELFFGREMHTEVEDIHIVRDIYDRLAINFHSKVVQAQFV